MAKRTSMRLCRTRTRLKQNCLKRKKCRAKRTTMTQKFQISDAVKAKASLCHLLGINNGCVSHWSNKIPLKEAIISKRFSSSRQATELFGGWRETGERLKRKSSEDRLWGEASWRANEVRLTATRFCCLAAGFEIDLRAASSDFAVFFSFCWWLVSDCLWIRGSDSPLAKWRTHGLVILLCDSFERERVDYNRRATISDGEPHSMNLKKCENV